MWYGAEAPTRWQRGAPRRLAIQSSTSNPFGPRLLDLLARCRETEQAFIAHLSEAERTALGTPDHWAVKDHLAHLTFWRRHAAEHLTAARGEAPDIIEDFQPVNERTFERERLTPWDEVMADAQRAHAELVDAVRGASEADLADPNHAPWSADNPEPLWWVVTGSGFEHPHEHYADLRVAHGDLAGAGALRRAAVEVLTELFPDSERSATALYNLGCFYAKTGQFARAIPAVRESLARVPNLVEWSKQDSDLDSLRDDPDFQAIYTV